MMFPKPKTFRSKPYLAFVRKHPCLVSDQLGAVVHHESLGQNYMGGKPPDTHGVPLLQKYHDLLNAPGHIPREMWEEWNIDPRIEIIKLLTEYLQEGK